MNDIRFHKGWRITQGPAHPATGVWRASRFGVSMCNSTLDALIRMIDFKESERCSQCGGWKPRDQSCMCFDNGGQ